MKRFVLFINGNLGLEVLRHVMSRKDTEIAGIIVNASNKRSANYLNSIKSMLLEYDQIVPIMPYENLPSDYSEVKELLYISIYNTFEPD